MKKGIKFLSLILFVFVAVYAFQSHAQPPIGYETQGEPRGEFQDIFQGGPQGGPIETGLEGGQGEHILMKTIPEEVKISLSEAVEIAKQQTNALITSAQLSLIDEMLVYSIEGVLRENQQSISLAVDIETGKFLSPDVVMGGISAPKVKLAEAVLTAEKTVEAEALNANLVPRIDQRGNERLIYSILLQKNKPASTIYIEIDAETGKILPSPINNILSNVKVSTSEAIKLARDAYERKIVKISLNERRGKPIYEVTFERKISDVSGSKGVTIDAGTGKMFRRFRNVELDY